MIPKILHYCWFGRGQMNDIILKCVESWKKYCPDYELVLWSEDSFDVHANPFVQEAYEEKKWAFVSDYVRLYALYHQGGVYVDTDVEILRPLDNLLDLGGVVTGYQDGYSIPAGIILAEPKNPWIEKLLSYYDGRHFRMEDGSLDITTNSDIITAQSINECGFQIGGKHIALGNVLLLDSVYFAPPFKVKNPIHKESDEFLIDPDKTYTIHYGTGTWVHKGLSFRCRMSTVRLARMILTDRVYIKIKTAIKKRDLENITPPPASKIWESFSGRICLEKRIRQQKKRWPRRGIPPLAQERVASFRPLSLSCSGPQDRQKMG